MSENWDMYFVYIQDKIASILLDMDIWKEIETEKYKYCFCLRLKIKEPNESGFPIDDEAENMNIIEDSIIEFLNHKNVINVGRITTDGIRDVIFYSIHDVNESIFEAANMFVKQLGYQFDAFALEEDQNWEFYFNYLYPNQYQIQHMGNSRVIDNLISHGDSLEEPRKVEHWIYFESKEKMNMFINEIIKEGFTIEDKSNQMNEEGKYMLVFSRIKLVNINSINEVTDLIVDLSEEFYGEYDGWETLVIKDN
jgi:uncharacterized protein (TIGR01619 family)